MKSEKDSLNDSTKSIIKHIVNISSRAIEQGVNDKNLYNLAINVLEHILITQRDYGWGQEYLHVIQPHFDNCQHSDLRLKFYTNLGAADMTRSDYKTAVINTNKAIKIYEPSPDKTIYASYLQAKAYNCVIRGKSITRSGSNRSPDPALIDHWIQ